VRRRIEIHPVVNGYVVAVDCQTLVFESMEVLLTEMRAYLTDPVGYEKAHFERYPPDGPEQAIAVRGPGAIAGFAGEPMRTTAGIGQAINR
jgi:hypothetical protein